MEIHPPTAEAQLEKHLPSIQALPAADVRTANVDAVTAFEVARSTAERLPADWPAVVATFRTPPERESAELVERALAYWAAEKRLDRIAPDLAPEDRTALFAEAGALREKGILVLRLVAPDDPVVEQVLAAVAPGTGHRDRADDLVALQPLLAARATDLAARGLFTPQELSRMGALAEALLAPRAAGDGERRAAADLRNRAWTWFCQAWTAVQCHVAFVLADDPTRLSDYPSLYRRPARAARPAAPVAAPAEAPPAEAPATAPATI